MKRTLLGALAIAACGGLAFLALTTFLPGQAVALGAPCPRNWGWVPAWLPRASPLLDLRFGVGTAHARVCYGAPSLRGRTMLGGNAVPFGKLWRTGANEPTTLHLTGAATLGGVVLGPGSYALYTIPGPESWTVIVNRSTRQWGLESEYTPEVERGELGRFTVAPETLAAPVERLAFRAEPGSEGTALLLEWQTTRIRMPLVALTP